MERKLEALLEIYCDFDDVGGLRNKTGRMYRVQTSEKGFYIIQKLLFQLRLFSASNWLNLDKFLPPAAARLNSISRRRTFRNFVSTIHKTS